MLSDGWHINTGGASKIPIKYAGGGTVGGPGSRTQDRVMASLSPSEEVISNDRGQADRWRPVLKMINANQPAASIAGKADRFAGVAPVSSVSSAPQQITVVLQSKGGVDLTRYIEARIVSHDNASALQMAALA